MCESHVQGPENVHLPGGEREGAVTGRQAKKRRPGASRNKDGEKPSCLS